MKLLKSHLKNSEKYIYCNSSKKYCCHPRGNRDPLEDSRFRRKDTAIFEMVSNIVVVLSLFAACFLFSTCSSVKRVGNNFTDTCTHCHGAQLEGVRNYTEKCGECHELNTLPPDKVTVSQRCEALMCEPHTHKMKNVFQPTPSCFSCHRKKDF